MKKRVRNLLSLVLVVCLLAPNLFSFGALALTDDNVSYYDGTYSTDWYYNNTAPADKIFHLRSAADLAGYAYLVNSVFGAASFGGYTVRLECNVVWNTGDASEWFNKAPKYSWTPISISQAHYSSGGFDGGNHYISGLYQNDNGSNHTGFIGVHGGSDLGIRNLAIVNSFFRKTGTGGSQNGNFGAGVFMSTPYNTFTFENLYTDAILIDASDHTGGIVGSARSNGTTINLYDCVFAGTIISAGEHVGGIFSNNNGGTLRIKNCLNLGSVYGSRYVGGILGSVTSSAVRTVEIGSCINAGSVGSIRGEAEGYVAAILGGNNANASQIVPVISNCVMVDNSSQKSSGMNAVNGSAFSVKQSEIFDNPSFNLASLDRDTLYTSGEFAKSWTLRSASYPLPAKVAGLADACGIEISDGESQMKFDFSWYDRSASEIVISTPAELEALSQIARILGVDFAGQTVKLGADIVYQEGNAAQWQSAPPAKSWEGIPKFAGTFDGDGHYISGLYYNGSESIALFNSTNNATVKNLMVLNSYFESTANGVAGVVASFGGQTNRVENVYCDAILRAHNHHNGGIGGVSSSAMLYMDGCVYAGSLYADMRYAGGILGNTNFNRVQITNCLNLGSIAAPDELGGIVGIGGNGTGDIIANCINAGYIGSYSNSYNGDVTNWYRHNDNDLSNGGIMGTVKGSGANLYKLTYDDCWLVTDFSSNKTSVRYTQTLVGEEKLITLQEIMGIDPKELDTEDVAGLDAAFAEDWAQTETYPLPKGVRDMMNARNISLNLDADGKPIQAMDMTWLKNYAAADVKLGSSSQLVSFANHTSQKGETWKGKTIYLSNDITFNEGDNAQWDSQAPQRVWIPLQNFAGTFDGQHHTLSGLYVNGTSNVAMFASVDGAVIKDFSLVNSYFASTASASGLVYFVNSTAGITDVLVDAVVKSGANNAGGIVGAVGSGVEIYGCTFDGSITGTNRVGGIIGNGNRARITLRNTLNLAKVQGGSEGVGGIIGLIENSAAAKLVMEQCVNVGSVSSAKTPGALIGSAGSAEIKDSAFLQDSAASAFGVALSVSEEPASLKSEELWGFGVLSHLDLEGWSLVYDWYPLPTAMIADHYSTVCLELGSGEEKEDSVFVGWKNDSYFLPGDFTFRFRDTAPDASQLEGFEALYLSLSTGEAVIRLAEPNGLGFFTRIDKAGLDALIEAGAEPVIGTVIAPTDYTEDSTAFTLDGLSAAYGENGFLNILKDDGWYNADTVEEDGYYLYRGSVVNLKKANLDRPFSGVGYVKLSYSDGAVRTLYGGYTRTENSDTAALTAEKMSADSTLSEAERNALSQFKLPSGVASVRFLSEYKDYFKVHGRSSTLVDGIACDWSASAIEFRLSCEGDVKISARGSYTTSLGSGVSKFTVYIDGVQSRTITVQNGYNKDIVIAQNLAKGEHTFRIVKWAHAESAQVNFTKLTYTGTLLERPADSDIYIEVIGDSISCGYGNNNGENDGNLSYGYLAAAKLGADYSIFARSGLWLVNNGVAAIPDLYPYVSWYRDGGKPGELYDFENARVPDVVVINLGTNDYNGNAGAERFAAAMRSFVADIRSHYGNDVPIVWAYGMMNDGYKSTIQSVVAELGGADANNYCLGFEQNNTGVGSHPDTAHQRQYGDQLAAYIQELLK